MKRLLVSLLLAAMLALMSVGTVFGHVHGITPLRCVAPENAGANQTDTTPASAVISGLIPSTVGNAPLQPGDGGFDTPACPA